MSYEGGRRRGLKGHTRATHAHAHAHAHVHVSCVRQRALARSLLLLLLLLALPTAPPPLPLAARTPAFSATLVKTRLQMRSLNGVSRVVPPFAGAPVSSPGNRRRGHSRRWRRSPDWRRARVYAVHPGVLFNCRTCTYAYVRTCVLGRTTDGWRAVGRRCRLSAHTHTHTRT